MGTDRRRDPRSLIEAIIREQTRYIRHYIGKVTNTQDTLARGRILVQVQELGWDNDSNAAWCWPRTRHAMEIPEIGEWVEVYFIAGDPNRPVYLGQAAEINDQAPREYDLPATRVLFQDPKSGDYIKYDQTTKELEIKIQGNTTVVKGAEVNLVGDTKTMVTYAALSTAIGTFIAALNTLFGTKLDGGGTPGTLTLDISTAEATKVKTS